MHGASHGNWWNAVVWGECRDYAGRYLVEIAQWYPSVETQARTLADAYAQLAQGFFRAADKELDAVEKGKIVADLKEQERRAIDGVERLLAALASESETAAA